MLRFVGPAGDAHARGGQEPARRGHLRRSEVVVALEVREVDAPAGSLSLPHLETHMQGAVHFHRRPAALGIALGVVGVAGGEEGAFGKDGKEQAGAAGKLLDVHVAAILPGRDGPQALGGEGFVSRYGAGRRGPHHHTATPQQFILPQQDFLAQRP